MTDVISIQSQVVHGHVGNSAAVFPMQAKGLQVAAVPTALLSNHPHYPTMHGEVLSSALVAGLLQGVEERGLTAQAKVILSGYLGSVGNGEAVADFVARAREASPALTYVCDPVMGDDDLGMFVAEPHLALFRDRLVPMAGVITPNQYEVERLAGHPARTAHDIAEAAAILRARGTGAVVVTGCVLADTAPGMVETILPAPEALHRTAIPRLPIRPCGTGDLFTGLLVARLVAGRPLPEATAAATREVLAVLERTRAEASQEMRISGFPFSAEGT